MPSEDDKASGPPSPSDALVEALRALVRQELKRPAPPPAPERPPTWRDGFWLLVLIIDVVLFMALIPENWWKNPALEVVGKILPWLGGGTFVLGVTWFRERLLAFSRSRAVNVLMAAALVPLLLLHVRFVPLRARIDPKGADFFVDGTPADFFVVGTPREGKGTFQGDTRIWIRLARHEFKIQSRGEGSAEAGDAGKVGAAGVIQPRVIEWSWTRLLRAWLGNDRPRWSPLYWVDVIAGEQWTVNIKPLDQLDADFNQEDLTKQPDSLEFKPGSNHDKFLLPFGSYCISAHKTGCEPFNIPHPVSVPLVRDEDQIDLSKMKCRTP